MKMKHFFSTRSMTMVNFWFCRCILSIVQRWKSIDTITRRHRLSIKSVSDVIENEWEPEREERENVTTRAHHMNKSRRFIYMYMSKHTDQWVYAVVFVQFNWKKMRNEIESSEFYLLTSIDWLKIVDHRIVTEIGTRFKVFIDIWQETRFEMT